MGNSVKSVLRRLWPHILYLRNNPVPNQVPTEVEEANVIEEPPVQPTEHEKLLKLLDEFDVAQLRQGLSLDTAQTPVLVLGKSYEDHISALYAVKEVFVKQHTVTRAIVTAKRIAFPGSSYFSSNEGYLTDRRDVVVEVLLAFQDFAQEYQRQHNLPFKGSVVEYNLKLTGLLISDMLSFVKALDVKDRTVPGDTNRDIERSVSQAVETDTP